MKIGKTSNVCMKKCCKEKLINLLSIREEGKRNYVLFKGINKLTYDHRLQRG